MGRGGGLFRRAQESGQRAQADADDKAEEVRSQVGPRALATEESEQSRARTQGQEAFPQRAGAKTAKLQPGEHADGGENRGGQANREVLPLTEDYVEQIAGRAGKHQQQPASAVAEHLAQQMDHQPANQTVASQVHQIGVQGQRGNQAPPLPLVEDSFGVDRAPFEPGAASSPRPGMEEEKGQQSH